MFPAATGSSAPPVAVLRGLAGRVPSRVVTNEHLARRLDTDDAWIRTRTGIRQRHVVGPGQATSDLAVEAGRRALASAGTDTADAVIVATTTPDHPCPATAPAVAGWLGLTGVAAFDIGAVRTGFVYGLASSAGLIAAGVAERVLLIGADAYSTTLDPLDRANAIIFGDGAGAVVVRAGHPDEPGAVGHFDLGSDGAHENLITVAAGGSRQRSRPGEPTHGERNFAMCGKEVYRHAVTRMAESARVTLDRAAGRPTTWASSYRTRPTCGSCNRWRTISGFRASGARPTSSPWATRAPPPSRSPSPTRPPVKPSGPATGFCSPPSEAAPPGDPAS